MSDPLDHADDVGGCPLAPYGTAKVRPYSNSLVASLPKLVVDDGQEVERWHHPETGAVLLLPEDVDPADVLEE